MRGVIAAAAALGLQVAACGSPPGLPDPVRGPLDAGRAEAILLAADDALRLAYERADASRLDGRFGGASLASGRARVDEMSRRGLRRLEEPAERHLVHFSGPAGNPEAVIEIRARQQLVLVGAPERPWSSTLRQWWARLRRSGESWLVVEDRDLAPASWWRS